MTRPPDKDVNFLDLDVRCRAATEAYLAAAAALDAALRRDGRATAPEWKAESDARVKLRHARAAYVAGIERFTALSDAELRATQHTQEEAGW
jgi:hypothetical protein